MSYIWGAHGPLTPLQMLLDIDRLRFQGNPKWSGIVAPPPTTRRRDDNALAVGGELSTHLQALQVKANPRAYIGAEWKKNEGVCELFPASFDA